MPAAHALDAPSNKFVNISHLLPRFIHMLSAILQRSSHCSSKRDRRSAGANALLLLAAVKHRTNWDIFLGIDKPYPLRSAEFMPGSRQIIAAEPVHIYIVLPHGGNTVQVKKRIRRFVLCNAFHGENFAGLVVDIRNRNP